jgi:SHS2 domain-containing protein
LPNEWNTEEFHYSDVVEVTYKPFDASNSSIRETNNDYPVEGYLTLSLVNSSKKEYPTTKKAVTNFISLAREKVRNAKRTK